MITLQPYTNPTSFVPAMRLKPRIKFKKKTIWAPVVEGLLEAAWIRNHWLRNMLVGLNFTCLLFESWKIMIPISYWCKSDENPS